MKVRAGSWYAYDAQSWDRFDARTTLQRGEAVQVVNLRGCPPCNTMGHAHVNRVDGSFAGLVCTASLIPLKNNTRRSR